MLADFADEAEPLQCLRRSVAPAGLHTFSTVPGVHGDITISRG